MQELYMVPHDYSPAWSRTAKNGVVRLPCRRDGRIARAVDLGVGQRAVRGPEPQREGQRLAARTDLLTAEDVEQRDVLEQRAGGRVQRALHVGGENLLVDHESDVNRRRR